MPIHHNVAIHKLDSDRYHSTDYEVMEKAFQIHNSLGKLHKEAVYKRELWFQCQELGFGVRTEVPIRVAYGAFDRTYFVDLLVENGIVYELKACGTLSSMHKSQVLNYMFLLGVAHGKLINFGSASVQHEFVTTTLSPVEQRRFQMDVTGLRACDSRVDMLVSLVEELCVDWGVFLEVGLYRDAIVDLLAEHGVGPRSVSVQVGTRQLGETSMVTLDDETAIQLTSISGNPDRYEAHLRRLLRTVGLSRFQWINLNRHSVVFKTIE